MRHLVVFTSALIASASSAQAGHSQTPATPAPPPAAASARGATTAGTSAVAMQGELLPNEQIQQVLNRLTFGPRPGDAEKVRAGRRQGSTCSSTPSAFPIPPATTS
jgi:hypothetical protein